MFQNSRVRQDYVWRGTVQNFHVRQVWEQVRCVYEKYVKNARFITQQMRARDNRHSLREKDRLFLFIWSSVVMKYTIRRGIYSCDILSELLYTAKCSLTGLSLSIPKRSRAFAVNFDRTIGVDSHGTTFATPFLSPRNVSCV